MHTYRCCVPSPSIKMKICFLANLPYNSQDDLQRGFSLSKPNARAEMLKNWSQVPF